MSWFPARRRLPTTRVPGVSPHPSTPFYQHSPPHQRQHKMNGIKSLNHQGHPAFDRKIDYLAQLSRAQRKYEALRTYSYFSAFETKQRTRDNGYAAHIRSFQCSSPHSREHLIGFLLTVDDQLTQSDKIHPSAKSLCQRNKCVNKIIRSARPSI